VLNHVRSRERVGSRSGGISLRSPRPHHPVIPSNAKDLLFLAFAFLFRGSWLQPRQPQLTKKGLQPLKQLPFSPSFLYILPPIPSNAIQQARLSCSNNSRSSPASSQSWSAY